MCELQKNKEKFWARERWKSTAKYSWIKWIFHSINCELFHKSTKSHTNLNKKKLKHKKNNKVKLQGWKGAADVQKPQICLRLFWKKSWKNVWAWPNDPCRFISASTHFNFLLTIISQPFIRRHSLLSIIMLSVAHSSFFSTYSPPDKTLRVDAR